MTRPRSTHPVLAHPIKRTAAIGSIALAALLTLTFAPAADACDSCNYGLLKQTLEERLDTPSGRDLLAAAKNQRGLPLGGISNIQQASEQILATHLAAQADAPNGAPAGASHDAQPQADDDHARSGNPGVIGPDAFDMSKVLERDAQLSIPATSYVDQDTAADHSVEITLSEGETYIGNGVMYDGFLINDKLPGPTVIVEEGDVVEFIVNNAGSIPHGASIHAAYTQTSAFLGSIDPGQTKSLKFRATYPGVFLYHCAPGGHAIPMHVMGGQYGMMIVKPKHTQYKLEQELGHEPDLEIYLAQHELYGSGKDAVEGNAAYTMFNGKLFRYVEEPIVARPGDYVRIYFMNVGPNLISTFHIVGIVWDYAYWQGHPEAVVPGGQTVLAGPSDTWVVEFRVPPAEGAYTMLSHAVGSTSRGAIGLLVADEAAPRPEAVMADGPVHSPGELEAIAADAARTLSPFGIGSAEADRAMRYSNPDEEVIVRIIGNSFYPKVIDVPVGTTVTWINDDVFTYLAGEFSGVHNVATVSGPERFASPLLGHAESWSHTFTEPGESEYLCAPHPYMRGQVRVTETANAEPATTNAWGTGPVLTLAVIVAVLAALTTRLLFVRKR